MSTIYVSPVFTDENGNSVGITPDMMVQFVPGTPDSTIQSTLQGTDSEDNLNLFAAAYPDDPANPNLTPNEVWMIMRTTVHALPPPPGVTPQPSVGPAGIGYNGFTGWGLPDAGAAVRNASNYWAAGMAIDPNTGWQYYLYAGREVVIGQPACSQALIVRDKLMNGSPTSSIHIGYSATSTVSYYPGYYPRAIGVGGDGYLRILDTSDSGTFRITLKNPDTGFTYQSFVNTPTAPWHVTAKMTVRASDNHTFVLLGHSSGPVDIVELDANLNPITTSIVPIDTSATPSGTATWMPEDLTLDQNGNPVILWRDFYTSDFQYETYAYSSTIITRSPLGPGYPNLVNVASSPVFNTTPMGSVYSPTSGQPIFGEWGGDFFVPTALRFASDGSAYVYCNSATARVEMIQINRNSGSQGVRWVYDSKATGASWGPTTFQNSVPDPSLNTPISNANTQNLVVPRFSQSAKAFAIGLDGIPRLMLNSDDRTMSIWKLVLPTLPGDSNTTTPSATIESSPVSVVMYAGPAAN